MTIVTGIANLLIGLAYTGLGFLAVDEMTLRDDFPKDERVFHTVDVIIR